MSLLSTLRSRSADLHPRVVDLRRRIHRNPELSRNEHDTAALVADALHEIGLDRVETGIYGTGVLGTLAGGRPGRTVLLRADLDALPIQEETGLDFASQNEGIMHACGHDAHTASLLGTAQILADIRSRVPGTIRFCFQPTEEKIPGGATFMIEEGVLEARGDEPAVDYVLGQHVRPDLPAGAIGVRGGPFMASADEVHVTVRGEGGHAASPHELTSDATVAAAHVVTALQTVVSRNSPPGTPSILTIGRFVADGATNVIPPSAHLEGTFRTMDDEWRAEAHDRIRQVVRRTAQAHGAEADVDVRVGYPAVHNDPSAASVVQSAAREYVGETGTVDLDPWYAGEDFAYFTNARPGVFYALGVGNKDAGIVHGLHTSQFTIDEDALRIGPGFMALAAIRLAGRGQETSPPAGGDA
jgi:hippurate hydrolase